MTLEDQLTKAEQKVKILKAKIVNSKKDVTLQELLDYAVKNKDKVFFLNDGNECLASKLKKKSMVSYLTFEDTSEVPMSYSDLTEELVKNRMNKVTGRQIAIGIKMLIGNYTPWSAFVFMKQIK